MTKFTNKTIGYESQPVYKALTTFFDSYFIERDYKKILSFMADEFEGIGTVEENVIEIDVHQTAARKFRIENIGHFACQQIVVAAGILAEIGHHQPDGANLGKQLLHQPEMGHKGRGYGIDEVQPLFFCQCHKLPHLLCLGTEGLFADHVFAGQQCLFGLLIVQNIGRGHINEIDVPVLQERIHIGVDFFCAKLPGQFLSGVLAAGVHGLQTDARGLADTFQNGAHDKAGADGTKADLLHGVSLLF